MSNIFILDSLHKVSAGGVKMQCTYTTSTPSPTIWHIFTPLLPQANKCIITFPPKPKNKFSTTPCHKLCECTRSLHWENLPVPTIQHSTTLSEKNYYHFKALQANYNTLENTLNVFHLSNTSIQFSPQCVSVSMLLC